MAIRVIEPSWFDVTSYGAVGDGSTDDVASIQAAINAAAANGGGIVFFPAHTYKLTATSTASGQTWHLSIVSDNISVLGAPGAKLSSSANASIFFTSGAGKAAGALSWANYQATNSAKSTVYTMTAAAKGDTSVTLSTAAQATNFSAGDYVLVRTGQTIAGGVTQPDGEINQVVSSDSGTGVVQLRWPLAKAYAQEYYVSGTSGVTSTSVTANPAPFGLANVNDRFLSNISIEGVEFSSTGTSHVLNGGQVVGLRLMRNRATVATGFQSMGCNRDMICHGNRVHLTGTGTGNYQFATDSCSSDAVFRDNLITGERVAFFHIHEGSSRVKVVDNTIVCPTSVSDENTVSIRGRAYDITVTGNTIAGGGSNTSVYVDPTCTGGGVIAGNTIAQATDPISVYATGWRIEGNNLTGGGGVSSTVAFDAPLERVAGVVRFDSQTVTLGSVPPYAYVTNVRIHVTQAFDSSGTDQIQVGYSGTDNAYATNTDVSTTGVKSPTLGANVGYQSAAHSAVAKYAAGGTAPANGKAVVVVEYFRGPVVT